MQGTQIENNNEKTTMGSTVNEFHENAQNEDFYFDERGKDSGFEFLDDVQGEFQERFAFQEEHKLGFRTNEEVFGVTNEQIDENYGFFQGDDISAFATHDEVGEEIEFAPSRADIPHCVFENTLSNESCTRCCLSKCFNRIFPLREILVSGVVTRLGCPLGGAMVKIAGEETKKIFTGANGRFSCRIVVCDQVSVTAKCNFQSLTRTIYFPQLSETANFNFN